ncbi:unnamed protein product [Cuscuta campestris]|uniref:Uncharacterized protein n=1 Tax=Cuscuta campestris TaxID=132261 RepID=A0A484LZK4_9ASTE|nr:unnamed protein product [Cuscuta campestris]
MSVVGFDVGNENCVIAVVRQRGIDVLLNDESKRETPSVVSFGEKQRFLGSAGAASATMNPKSTISQFKRLIGKKYMEPSVQNDLKLFPFETSEGADGGILIHLQYINEKQTFTPIQILAMLFAHLKQIAEKNIDTQASDCVIGVPSYFTDLQRRCYLQAAEIGGLKPLRLIHDCTATALGYGIYKTDLLPGSPTNVVFVDIGHCDTQVSVASFEHGHMKMLSHAFDVELGGRDFDELLFRHFARSFKEQYNIDVYSNARASVRLRSACERLKKVLSANAEAPLNIECLMDEKDVKGYIRREEFEKLSSLLLERISVPCRHALRESGLHLDNIHNIELVGSGSRIPAITKVLSQLFGKEPTRTLNASECVARGCALQAAMLSPAFRVREYEVQDSYPFSIGFASDGVPICSPSNGTLFPKGHLFPSMKILTLHRSKSFHMEAFYTHQIELPSGVSTKICSFTIGPFQVSSSEKTRVKVRVQLNVHGLVEIDSVSLVEDQVADFSTEDTFSDNNEGDKTKKGKSIKRLEIPFTEHVDGAITQAELCRACDIEHQLAEHDKKVERTKDKKNTLEAYVYETRNKLLNTYRSFATDSEREDICSNLQQTEDWLYEDGDDESEQIYSQKLEGLKKIIDPVEQRYMDEDARAQETRNLLHCIVEYRIAAESLPASEKDYVISECDQAEQWLREKSQQQDALPKNANPVLWSSDIKRKADILDASCKRMLRSSKWSPPSNADMDTDTDSH